MSPIYGLEDGLGATPRAVIVSDPDSAYIKTVTILSTTIDAGATPTTFLRAGLLLSRIPATGLYTNYTDSGSLGQEKADCVLLEGVNMLDGAGVVKNTVSKALFAFAAVNDDLIIDGDVGNNYMVDLDNIYFDELVDTVG